MPLVRPGVLIPPGACLYSGPYVIQLQSGASFAAFTPRPAPAAPPPMSVTTASQAPISLVHAGLTALPPHPFGRVFTALLLANPRTASTGMDRADLHTSARVLHADVTIVRTHPAKTCCVGWLRPLSDHLEVINVILLSDETSAVEAQARDRLALKRILYRAASSAWTGGE